MNNQDVIQALAAGINSFRPPHYKTSLAGVTVLPAFDAKRLKDKVYPKVFIFPDALQFEDMAAEQSEEVFRYVVTFVGCVNATTKTAVDSSKLADNFIEDLRKYITPQLDLGGIAQDVQITEATIDGGFCFPEAVAVCNITVKTIGRR